MKPIFAHDRFAWRTIGGAGLAMATAFGATVALAQSGFVIGGSPSHHSEPSESAYYYLAPTELIGAPILGLHISGTAVRATQDVPKDADPQQALVDAFKKLCLDSVLKASRTGPSIDVNVLDGISPEEASGRFQVTVSSVFCVRKPDGVSDNDEQAMARELATTRTTITPSGYYVPKMPFWCGGMQTTGRGLTLPVHDITISHPSSLQAFRLGARQPASDPLPPDGDTNCWAIGKTADYATVAQQLGEVLMQSGRGFEPDPTVADGSILLQRAWIETDQGVTRTVLLTGRKFKVLKGPDVEIHAFLGRFIHRPVG